MKNHKLKKKSFFENIYENGKKIINIEDIEIKKQKLDQHERPFSIKNIDINKTVLSNKVSFGKRNLNISLATKILKN